MAPPGYRHPLYHECKASLNAIKKAEDDNACTMYDKSVAMFPACKHIWETIEAYKKSQQVQKHEDSYKELAKIVGISLSVATYKSYVKYHCQEARIRELWKKRNFTPTKLVHWQGAYERLHSKVEVAAFGVPPAFVASAKTKKRKSAADEDKMNDVELENHALAQRVAKLEEELSKCKDKLRDAGIDA